MSTVAQADPRSAVPLDEDGLSQPSRSFAFLVVGIATSMAVLDSSIVNIALPSIARELNVPPVSVIGLVTVYQLAVVTTLLPLSSLGDRLGYARVYTAGLAVFTFASMLCAIMPSLNGLLAARALQGFGAAGIMSVNMALIRFIYPRRLIGIGVANAALVVAISSAAGPGVAALILAEARWQWLFLVNIPLGLCALLIARGRLPRTPANPFRFDVVGALLNCATLALFVFGVSFFEKRSTFGLAVICLAASAVSGVVFYRQQRDKSVPILPVDLFRKPIFALSIVTSICAFIAQSIGLIVLPFMLEGEFGRTTMRTGLLISAWPISIALVSRVSGRLNDRIEPGIIGCVGLTCFAGGLIALGLTRASMSDVDLAWRIALCGAGFGLFLPSNNKAMLESAPPQRSGGASGMQSTARLFGQSVGAAAMAVMFALFPQPHLRLPLFVAAGFGALGTISSISRRGRSQAR